MKLWLDDWREVPDGPEWMWAKTWQEAVAFLDAHEFDEISLDHDLGLLSFQELKTNNGRVVDERTGYHVLMYIVRKHLAGDKIPIGNIHVHTDNPVARERMLGVIDRYLTE